MMSAYHSKARENIPRLAAAVDRSAAMSGRPQGTVPGVRRGTDEGEEGGKGKC